MDFLLISTFEGGHPFLVRTIRVLGIIFALMTVALAVYSFFNHENESVTLFLHYSTWSMITMCLSLIFNGTHFYLYKNSKDSKIQIIVGSIILIVVLITALFDLILM